jgi:hypothetical protein
VISVAAGAKLPDRDLLLQLETPGASILGSTIMRTHTSLAIGWALADTQPSLVIGFIVDNAPTVTNLDPSVAFGDDWLHLQQLAPGTVNRQMMLPSGTPTNYFAGHEFDLRGKRRIHQLGMRYFMCLTNNGNSTLQINAFTRTLVALP